MYKGVYARYSDIGGREKNEDKVQAGYFKGNLVAIVADGLGGEGDGELASASVCESLIKCGSDGKFPDQSVIRSYFDQANRELISKQKNQFHMKSTAVYLCINGNRAIWGNVGDSRLYHLYGGKLCEYTLDHSASQMSVFLGEITREQIPFDSGRSRLLRAMGVPDVKPDIHDPIILEPGLHGFLLCSDGLWEYLDDETIVKGFSEFDTPKELLKHFYKIKKSKSSKDCDNNSAVAVYWEVKGDEG